MKLIYWLLIILVFLPSCDYYYEKKIGDSYYIRCIEDRKRMDIGFGTKEVTEELISNTVFEIHWNDNYILAKRHPRGEIPNPKSVTEYYIIKKVRFGEAKARDNMWGPLDLSDYLLKIGELNLDEESMKSVTFEDLK